MAVPPRSGAELASHGKLFVDTMVLRTDETGSSVGVAELCEVYQNWCVKQGLVPSGGGSASATIGRWMRASKFDKNRRDNCYPHAVFTQQATELQLSGAAAGAAREMAPEAGAAPEMAPDSASAQQAAELQMGLVGAGEAREMPTDSAGCQEHCDQT
jgi:hypothetical protein